jgi:hypothetical protein
MEQPARGNAAGVFDESHHGKLAALNGFDFEPVVVAARAIWRGDEIRMPARMALSPPLENRKLGRKIIRCESDPKIAPATNAKMQALGIFTGLDLRNQELAFLEANFRKAGAYYYSISRGIDFTPPLTDDRDGPGDHRHR